MRYFRLATDCFLVEGKNEGALYDVLGCRIFLLDEEAHKLLRKCEDNELLGDCLGNSEICFLEWLQDNGLGFFDSEPAHIDKFLLTHPMKFKGLATQPPEFFKVDWSITNQCDLQCPFCGRKGETISWNSCQTCVRRDKNIESEWKPGNPEDFVNKIAGLGAGILHIRGGNPLLNPNYLHQIIRSVRHTSLNLIVTTPGTGLDIREIINLCKGGPVSLNIVMFGSNAEVAEAVCGYKGIFRQQLTLFNALIEAKLPFFVTFLLTQSSSLQRKNALEFIRYSSGAGCSVAEIHFLDAMDKGFRLCHAGEHTKPLTPWQSGEDFFSRVQFNSCMRGRFEISSDGKLRSCAGMHQVYGNVADDGLRKALSNTQLYNIRGLNKGSVQPCKDCVLRYACVDCSVFEREGEHNSIIKEAYCPHHPNLAPQAYKKEWSSEGFIHTLRMHYFHI